MTKVPEISFRKKARFTAAKSAAQIDINRIRTNLPKRPDVTAALSKVIDRHIALRRKAESDLEAAKEEIRQLTPLLASAQGSKSIGESGKKRINAADASARATAVKAEAIAERRAQSTAKRNYGKAWITQRSQMLKAAVDGKKFYETAGPIVYCRDLLALGFAVYEVPIASDNIFEKLAIDYSPRLNKAQFLAIHALDALIDKMATVVASLHGGKRQFHSAMRSGFNKYINEIANADDIFMPDVYWGFVAEVIDEDDLYDMDKFISDAAHLTNIAYRSQFDALAKLVFELKTIEFELENKKSEIQDLRVVRSNVNDTLDPFMELSSEYKLFQVRWADNACDFEAEGEFSAGRLYWICSQVGISYLNAVFDVIEDAVNKGNKSIDFIFLDKNDEWEISSKSMPLIYSISPALLGEILTLADYSVEIKDVSEQSKKLIVAW